VGSVQKLAEGTCPVSASGTDGRIGISQRYVSRELTHFVGKSLATDNERFALLVEILRAGLLKHGYYDQTESESVLRIVPSGKLSSGEMYSPGAVCFCDIPLADLSSHMTNYSRVGLALDKRVLIQRGASPVLYVANNSVVERAVSLDPEGAPKRSELFDDLGSSFYELSQESFRIAARKDLPAEVIAFHRRAARIFNTILVEFFGRIKCFDDSLSDCDPKNFYMEREWRVMGNVAFDLAEVSRVIFPREFASRFRSELPAYIGQITFAD